MKKKTKDVVITNYFGSQPAAVMKSAARHIGKKHLGRAAKEFTKEF